MVNPPRRSQASRRAATRAALLAAAADLFARRGYQAVSLDEIAAAAGLTRGALHYNVDGKADLMLTLMEERIGARTQTATPDLTFDRDASLLFLEFAAASARDPELGARLLDRLYAARSAVDGGDDRVHILGAFVNGLSIEALAGADMEALERRLHLLVRLLDAP